MSGAPFAYKTTNISVLGLFAGDGGLQDVLAADDPDGTVVNLDRIEDRTDVSLARIGIAGVQLVGHQSRKCIDLLGVDSCGRAAKGPGLVEGCLRALALAFQGGGTLPQDIIQLNDAILNRPIKALQAIFRVAQFFLQGNQPLARGFSLRGLAFDQRL
ncbi:MULTISPECIES: hypothetical protein [Bradyrhizobium]|uniref:hypothetical protein n=1 Tax=Bradyrhizobium TaxID=374 RepID=UPI001FCEF151|nr:MULTISPECIES: hypothetical protein [Bradyrhizobium]MDU1491304.1 hypothetical protein [Bradyrhizobium sp.]MDU1541482.1 hypothetical protein [Bradyrhizobium sp.]MDU1803492.1 hypothetical protein [Bradyrhizobium sp.]MDU2923824.1 hypothetical protein [Bradyrhizobium sp.]MDU3040002.1 hypothetical protein [Bradyrhizobium sp.]